METITRLPVKDQIYEIIKKRILTQEYKLGEKINILAITKELAVSNTPVREALSMLERDGLVEVRPNAGPSVIEFSAEIFSQVTEAVCSLLLCSFDLCLRKGRLPLLTDKLEKAFEKQVASYASSDELEFAQAAINFDSLFVTCSDNPYISKMYDEIGDIFNLVVYYDHEFVNTIRQSVIDEHSDILNAVKEKDAEKVKKSILFHYDKRYTTS